MRRARVGKEGSQCIPALKDLKLAGRLVPQSLKVHPAFDFHSHLSCPKLEKCGLPESSCSKNSLGLIGTQGIRRIIDLAIRKM